MDKKILLFTTIGKLTEESKVHVNASFTSWKNFGFDVVVFGEDFHKDLCDNFGFILNTEVEKSEFGIPLVRGLFESALEYEGYDLYCYINSDIIMETNPRPYLDRIEFKNYMAIGQRLDVWDYPNISKTFLHNPGGLDYFFFTPTFRDWSDMPDFSIARCRFDHWIAGAAMESEHPTIDLSEVFLPLHPEPKNRVTSDFAKIYADGNPKLGYQILRNNILFAKAGKHGQANMTSHIMNEEGLKKRTDIPPNEFGKVFV